MKLSLEFLGTGTSVGVPVIGCACAVCTSSDPRNQRLRSSALVRGYDESGAVATTVVIDTPPDFRQQMLRAKVRRLDGVVITHCHADHIVGLDDVRRFNTLQRQVLECWGTAETLAGLRHGFGYAFSEDFRWGWPCLTGRECVPGKPFEIGILRFEPVELDHVITKTTGFRITCRGSQALAYCLDVKNIPKAAATALEGTDTLVLDMLRDQPPHPTHLIFSEALRYVSALRPRRTFFGHMGHEVDHATFEARLPAGVRLAYDGLVLELD